MSSAFGKRKKSDGRDFYPTDPLFTEILCDKIPFKGAIWEPACGDGAIVNVLRNRGHRVVATDAFSYLKKFYHEKLDFLGDHDVTAPNIVTNPPSFCFDMFLVRALERARNRVAFLFGSFILTSSRSRYENIFKKHRPYHIIHIVNRMKVFGESSQFTHCWAIWDKQADSNRLTTVEWVLK